ncbi:hypothetical protein EON81_18680 [bacterium]|nr:MAG: hypothetical protein EON81_18680 [bacterium]
MKSFLQAAAVNLRGTSAIFAAVSVAGAAMSLLAAPAGVRLPIYLVSLAVHVSACLAMVRRKPLQSLWTLLLIPLLVALAGAAVAAAWMRSTDLVPMSLLGFGATMFSLSSNVVADSQRNDVQV